MPADLLVIDAITLAPLLGMVLLTLGVGAVLFASRIQAVRNGMFSIKYFRVRSGELPEALLKPERHFQNLFEVPVLFYVLYVLQLQAGTMDATQLTLAWLFVAARYGHALIHLGYNNVMHRLLAFLAGFLILVAMWVRFGLALI